MRLPHRPWRSRRDSAPGARPAHRLAAVWRWTRRALVAGAVVTVLGSITLAVAVYGWDYPVAELSPDRGGPLVLRDRHGLTIATVPTASRTPGPGGWVALDKVPAVCLATFLVAEDDDFFQHGGVSWRGLGRAAWLDLSSRRLGYGGSTITMQLVRMLDSAGQPRTVANKIKEAVLAMRLERAVDKRTILEQYVNRAYFGNGAYGIDAAARTYFGKPAAGLSAGEATLLAVLPRAPSAYDPLRHLGAALRRRDHVLALLREHDALSPGQVQRARAQRLHPRLHRPERHAPHFVDWVLSTLPPEIRARGGVVQTTLDLPLEERMEQVVRDHVAALEHKNVDQAGVVVLDTETGEILAMVGSVDYDGPAGQVNIVTRRRHPGSALKPFVYGLAIEDGDSPASIAYDIAGVPRSGSFSPTQPAHGRSPSANPHVGQPEHGPVRYREALAGSYNLAAVHTLEKVGIARLMTVLRRAGVGALPGRPEDYGLRLALGSTEVRLLDLAAGYGFLVRGGQGAAAHRGAPGPLVGRRGVAAGPSARRPHLLAPERVAGHGHAQRPGGAPARVRPGAAGRPAVPHRGQDRDRARLQRHRDRGGDPRADRGGVGRHLRRHAHAGAGGDAVSRAAGARGHADRQPRARPDPAAGARRRGHRRGLSAERALARARLPSPQARALRPQARPHPHL